MNENAVSSKKVKLGKVFIIVWIVMAITLGALSVVTYSKYSKYMDGQDAAIDTTLFMFKVGNTENYNEYSKYKEEEDHDTLVEYMYDFYHPEFYPSIYNTEEARDAFSDMCQSREKIDETGAKLMNKAGYECDHLSYYLDYYNNLFDYASDTTFIYSLYIAWIGVAVIALIITILYSARAKKSIVIEDGKIICKKGKNTKKEFFIKDVKSVDTTSLKGLKIVGNGIKYKMKLVSNVEEIRKTIMDYNSKLQE